MKVAAIEAGSTSPAGAKLGRLALFGLGWLLLLIGALSYWTVLQPVLADARDQDFLFFYMGAKVGVEHGWAHLYDLQIQREAFAQLRPGHPWDDVSRFINPPPLAWLVLPLTWLPVPAGYVLWVALGLGALVLAWRLAAPGGTAQRTVLLLAALAWYPVVMGVRTGQPGLLVLGLVTLSWFLLQRGRPALGGAILALTAIKPTMVLLVGPALLVAGHRRAFAAWAATTALLAAASLVLLGGHGTRQFLDVLGTARGITGARGLTLRYILGSDTVTAVAQVALAALTLALAWWRRSGGLGGVYAIAILGSLLSAPYLHAHDLPVLLLVFWLRLREGPDALESVLMVLVALSVELVNVTGPLPVLGSLALWLAVSLYARGSRREGGTLASSPQLTSR